LFWRSEQKIKRIAGGYATMETIVGASSKKKEYFVTKLDIG
jgi:hypothetical protein